MRLEDELRALGAALDWPPTSDVAEAVVARLEPPARRRRPLGRRAALVLAVLVAAVAAVLAVPPARTAILDWLGIGGASIVRVDELPALQPVPGLEALGVRATLDEAHARAGFSFSDPPEREPVPDEILVAPAARVTYVWRGGERVRLLITQFRGDARDPGLLKKLVGERTRIEHLRVGGRPAVWLEGGPHAVYVLAPDGVIRPERGWLAGNTLLVARRGVTVRVEGLLEREDAVALVEAMGGG